MNDRVQTVTGHPLTHYDFDTTSVNLNDVTILPPFDSGKIVGVGLNFKDHILELERKGIPSTPPSEPVIFFKAPGSVIAAGEPIVLPPESSRVEYEAELGFYVKKTARRVPREEADDYIFGYTCVNDVTARDLQRSDVQWTRAKSFDTFCPAGPFVESGFDWPAAEIIGMLNDAVVQRGRASDMLFDPPSLLSFISHCFTLNPGDLVAIGTPAGVGPLKSGDRFTVKIPGIGELTNPVQVENGANPSTWQKKGRD